MCTIIVYFWSYMSGCLLSTVYWLTASFYCYYLTSHLTKIFWDLLVFHKVLLLSQNVSLTSVLNRLNGVVKTFASAILKIRSRIAKTGGSGGGCVSPAPPAEEKALFKMKKFQNVQSKATA